MPVDVMYFILMVCSVVINEGCVLESNRTEGKCSVSESRRSNLTETQLNFFIRDNCMKNILEL